MTSRPTLAELLRKPGLGGHAMTSAAAIAPPDGFHYGTKGSERDNCLREIALARALYRCGDWEGLGEQVLKQYARDLRGVYALHANAVLKQGR